MKLNNTAAISKQKLPGEYRPPMSFGPESSPEFDRPVMGRFMRNTDAGVETLASAMECLRDTSKEDC